MTGAVHGGAIVQRAEAFARDELADVWRDDTFGRWHICEHLAEVAALTRAHGGTPLEVAAAWLHDVVEDSNVTALELESLFGAELAQLVERCRSVHLRRLATERQ